VRICAAGIAVVVAVQDMQIFRDKARGQSNIVRKRPPARTARVIPP
jgi:hypothetical protein